MARKKSLNELNAQIWRIGSMGTSSHKDVERRLRADSIYHRYVDNIQRTRQFQQDWKDGKSAGFKILRNRKYSQREYMGLSNG